MKIFSILGVSVLINILFLFIYRFTGTNEIGNIPFRLYSKTAKILVINTVISILLLITGIAAKMVLINTIKQDILTSINSFNDTTSIGRRAIMLSSS
jgi:hypothetical protein